jgi:hypothetical protein
MKYQIGVRQNLKAVYIYDPKSNNKHSVLLDEDKGLVIGFDQDGPFYPVCNAQIILDEANGPVLVPGSIVYGFACWQCYDDVYRLGEKPESLEVAWN